MRKHITILCLLGLVAGLVGCEASLQGARRQFESTLTLPARVVQGGSKVPVSLPTPAATVRGLGTRQVTATMQGLKKHEDELFREME